jgi:hypothetical protein
MSVNAFIPKIWSDLLVAKLDKTLVYASLCNRNYEGEIRGGGDTVKIGQVGDVTVSTYTPNSTSLSWEKLNIADITMVIDQMKSFSFEVDDVDKAQLRIDPMAAAIARAAYGIADGIDQFVAGKYTEADTANAVGSTGSPIDINSANVLEQFGQVSRKLSEANVPNEGRWIVIPPWLHMKLVIAKYITATDNNAVMSNGMVANMLGFNIYVSNNVPIVSSTKYKILAGNDSAITFASQLTEMEAIRRESSFADGIKGLYVYGGKVVQPKALAVLTATEKAE